MFSTPPPATRALLVANVLIFLLQQLAYEPLTALFALWPIGSPLFHPWQVVTYAFLHAQGLMHILFNMFALYMFGSPLESYWGTRRFVMYYFASVLAAAGTE